MFKVYWTANPLIVLLFNFIKVKAFFLIMLVVISFRSHFSTLFVVKNLFRKAITFFVRHKKQTFLRFRCFLLVLEDYIVSNFQFNLFEEERNNVPYLTIAYFLPKGSAFFFESVAFPSQEQKELFFLQLFFSVSFSKNTKMQK